MSGKDEGSARAFGFLPDDSPPSLLRDLQNAQSPEEWGKVLGRAVDELAALHYSKPREYEAADRLFEWEVTSAKLRKLVERGFQPKSKGRRMLGARANHDANAIERFGQCRTQAEAIQFLQTIYRIPKGEARSRVRRAVKAGLRLEAGKVNFGRKSAP